ncbi:MAG: DUF4012 domain-containing protein [Anaerolineae bacterium]|nr:DUF4012 domain-containing protein [Anaerolineae bacterium]
MTEPETSSVPPAHHAQESVPLRRRRRRRSRRNKWGRRLWRRVTHFNWRVVTVMFVSLLSVLVMAGVLLAVMARERVEKSWESLDRVWFSVSNKPGTELTLSDFELLQQAVGDLNGNLSGAKKQTSFLRVFAPLNADLETTLHALDAAQELSLAANAMLNGLEPAFFFLTGGSEEESVATQISSGERVVELLSLGHGRFLSADQHLARAGKTIRDFKIEDVSPGLLTAVDGLEKYHQQLVDINQMLLESPELLTLALGLEEPQAYLVLAQNSDEIRPSGGYISTYGWFTVGSGRILNYDYSASTINSPNPPPAEYWDEVDVPDWWFMRDNVYAAWDGSWYADFPSTAQMNTWYYDNGRNPESPIDGVFSIDLVGFEYILEALGGVNVQSYDVAVTAATFRDEIYKIRSEGSNSEHKRFLAALYKQIMNDWQSVEEEESIELRGALLRALQEKHIMIYFTDQTLNEAADILGWSGSQDSGRDQDYVMVADTNMGNKASRSVIRQLTYDVSIQPDGSLHNRVAVSYDYSARVAEDDPAVGLDHGPINYSTLAQIFVPYNSVLTNIDNLLYEPSVVVTDYHTIFVTRVGVDYNENQRIQLSFETPPLVEAFGRYRRYILRLQKQPGMIAEFVNVQVTLPGGATLISSSPSASANYNLQQPILDYRIELLTDQTIEIIYRE